MVAEEREGVRTPETAVQEEGDVEMGDWGGDSAGRNSGAEGRDRSAGDGEGYGPSAPKRRKLDGDDASETEEGEQGELGRLGAWKRKTRDRGTLTRSLLLPISFRYFSSPIVYRGRWYLASTPC